MSNNEAADRQQTVMNLKTLYEQKETVTKRIKGTSSLFLNEEYSDLTIICKSEVFPAHKNILCTGSAYFKAACGNPAFIESQGIIDIKESEPMLLKKVLSFLYTGDYDFAEERKAHKEAKESKGTKRSADGDLIKAPATDKLTEEEMKMMEAHPAYLHYRVYAEADYFMVDDLKAKAGTYFEETTMAKRLPADTLLEMIEEIWADGPNFTEVKEAVVADCVRNLRYYQRGRQPMLTSEFLEEHPQFATALCLELSKEHIRVLDSLTGPQIPRNPIRVQDRWRMSRGRQPGR
ncbi:uncharacterized protein N7483_003584 [Penicillium malachiteum]|uniref:uncharacterized protein n=1 Tax=Penicillium malachiteum TaxID=1324776 RepID=UPI002546FDB9|nr:uncharacterized protein N7483_003584 [Penicillium malachiteum]KAJ5729076.1 hypothetical protein N7483_003584 [Penicillium malachiteum]